MLQPQPLFFHFTTMKSEEGHRKKLMAMPKALSREREGAVVYALSGCSHTCSISVLLFQRLHSGQQSSDRAWLRRQLSWMPSQCAPSWSILLVSQRFLVEVTSFHIVLWWKKGAPTNLQHFQVSLPCPAFLWIWPPKTQIWRMQNTFEPLIPRRHKLHSHQVDKVFLAQFTFMFWRTTTDFILGNLEVKYAWDWKSLTDLLWAVPNFQIVLQKGCSFKLLPLALLASNNIVIQLAQCRYPKFHFQPVLSTMRREMCCSRSKNSFSLKNGRQKTQNSTHAHHPSKKTITRRWFQTCLMFTT